jgi:hypothetical protein
LFLDTDEVKTYKAQIEDINFVLIDTPGFDDSRSTDVMTKILEWLQCSYQKGTKLNGLIYMHGICNPRVQGTSQCYKRMFYELCGEDFCSHVILATSFWDVTDSDVAIEREKDLCENDDYWGKFVKEGSRVARVGLDVAANRSLLLQFAQTSPCALQVQRELNDGDMKWETSAVQELRRHGVRNIPQYGEEMGSERELRQHGRTSKQQPSGLDSAPKKDLRQILQKHHRFFEDLLEEDRAFSRNEIDRMQAKVDGLEAEVQTGKSRLKMVEEELQAEKDQRKQIEQQLYKHYTCLRRNNIPKVRMYCDKCERKLDTRRERFYRKYPRHMKLYACFPRQMHRTANLCV